MKELLKTTVCSYLVCGFIWVMFSPPAAAAEAWSRDLGLHRAVVRVDRAADAVRARIVWRRPSVVSVVIHPENSEESVANVVLVELNEEFGQIVFQPTAGKGNYFIYYLPPYPSAPEADDDWLTSNKLNPDDLKKRSCRRLAKASFVKFEAINDFSTFTEMERIATAAETQNFIAEHRSRPYLLFPEKRDHQIRMTQHIPLCWVKKGPSNELEDTACRGEFFAFQLGVYAFNQAIMNLDIDVEDLKSASGDVLPASAMRCLTKGGTDWLGRRFENVLEIEKGKVRALWFGIEVPEDAKPGSYTGGVTISPKGLVPTRVEINIEVEDELIVDAGTSELWRMARLKWLDSTIGLDDEPTLRFPAVTVEDATIGCLGRDVTLNISGFPSSIRSYFAPDNMSVLETGKQLLNAPIQFLVEDDSGRVIAFRGDDWKYTGQKSGLVTWEIKSQAGDLSLHVEAKMEFDGFVEYRMYVTALKTTKVNDIRLEIPLASDAAPYMMGMGKQGGFRKGEHKWNWDQFALQDSVWLGSINGGIRCQIYDDEFRPWPIIEGKNLEIDIPEAWGNNGKGGVDITEEAECLLVKAYSGQRTIQAGQTLNYNFSLMLTPFKTIDLQKHWKWRYYQVAAGHVKIPQALEVGANRINLHQGNNLNPYINYPFRTADLIKEFVKEAHDHSIRVGVYYTIRELSTQVYEMWALRSFGDEIFVDNDGPIGGSSWERDHLVDHYLNAWTAVLEDGGIDTSLATTSLSRWHNYYLEGLRYLLQNVGIDGLYLDGIGYGRDVMKRVRKTMDEAKPGCIIDWHNGNTFQPQYGFSSPMNRCMGLLPYVDRLWFGEMYDYGGSPDYWLIEMSGIPFGLMNEMIGGDRFKGSVYGMTSRMGWAWGANTPMARWKLWDDFGIEESKMIGYWVPGCPVSVDVPSVHATIYVKSDKALISAANWSDKQAYCKFKIDWKAIGLDPEKVQLRTPPMDGMQGERVFGVNDVITIQAHQGLQIYVEAKP
jgi:hypothetical protein